jgi:hypothetical protein
LTRIDGASREKILSYSVGIEPEDDAETASLVFFFDDSGNTAGGGVWVAGEYEIKLEVHAADATPVRKTIHFR